MKHKFTLLAVLFFAMFGCIISCQKDDSHLSKNFSDGSSRMITLNELKGLPKAYEKFNDVLEKQKLKSTTDSLWKFEVLTENILLYEKNGQKSLTFMVQPERQRSYLENLVLNLEADGSYSVYYAVYDLTEQEKEMVTENRYVNYSQKMFMCYLPDYDISLLTKNIPIGDVFRVGDDCYQRYLIQTQSWSDIPGQLEVSRNEVIAIKVDCKYLPAHPSFTEDDRISPGTPNNPHFNTPTPNLQGAYTPGTGPPDKDPVTTRPFRYLINMLVKKECTKIADVMSTGNYRQNLQTLATKVSDVVNENGNGLDDSNNPVTFVAGPQININGNGITKYKAVCHTHNNQTDGTYSVFSFSDLVAFAKLMKANRIDSTFVATLSTYKGTHYALVISDVAKFKEFFFYKINVLSNLDDAGRQKYSDTYQKAEKLNVKYYNDPNNPLIKQTDTNNVNVLNQFLTFMNEANMGVMLFETDATFQNFTQVTKSNNGQIARTACN